MIRRPGPQQPSEIFDSSRAPGGVGSSAHEPLHAPPARRAADPTHDRRARSRHRPLATSQAGHRRVSRAARPHAGIELEPDGSAIGGRGSSAAHIVRARAAPLTPAQGVTRVRVNLNRTPFAPVAVAFGVGIAISSLATQAVFLVGWVITGVGCIALLAGSRTGAASVALLLGVVATGGLRGGEAPLPPDHVRNLGLPRTLRIEGRLAGEPRRWAPGSCSATGPISRATSTMPSGAPVSITSWLSPASTSGS